MQRARRLVQQAVEQRQIPGAALGWVGVGEALEVFYLGQAQLEPEPVPLRERMYWDLASLTKVLFTVPEVLRLAEEGLADLDDPLQAHLPELAWLQDTSLPRKTLRELLTHTAGLPAWEPVYTWGSDRETLKARLLQHSWPLGEPQYSDLGYMLLGLILERARARPLAEFLLPEGLTFHPDPENAVATERCPWRNRVLRGEVHDENAYALGGVAGHAGLFGSIEGILGVAQSILEGKFLSPAALEEMSRPHTEERTLGWVRKHKGWSGGGLAGPRAIGHTGFTGTGLWIDQERGYAWALLTNRVHPSRHRETGIQELRQKVGNVFAAEWRGA